MAVQNGLVEYVKIRVREGVDVNERIFKDGHYLQLAVRAGEIDMVKALLELNADVDAQGGKCICALDAAAFYGQEGIVVVLLDNEADMSITTPSGETVLSAAARSGQQAIMKLLLDRGSEVFNDDWSYHVALYGFSLVRMAGWDNEEEFPHGLDPTTLDVITRMTNHGLDLTASMPGCTAAALLLLVADPKDTIQMMITKGANINERMHQDLPLLMLAAVFNSENAIRNLVECGAELGVENETGDTVLHNAIINKSDSVLQ